VQRTDGDGAIAGGIADHGVRGSHVRSLAD
jgi:hypothetical protein